MCVIVLKFKGADFPSKQVISACMKENPHGFAAAWNQDGTLHTFRTMDSAEMLAKYDEIRHLDPASTGLVFHARIATHGSKTLANCHCWTDEAGTLAFAHNGVLNNVGNRGDLTDSETFFRDIFLPVRDNAGMELALKVSSAIIGQSKFAFINAEGVIVPMGAYSKDCEPGHKGMIYFSNMHWTRQTMPQFPFDKAAPKKKAAPTCKPASAALRPSYPSYPAPKPRTGSLVVERNDDGSIKEIYVKDLLKKESPAKAAGTLF